MRILAIETSTPRGTIAFLDRETGAAEEWEFTSQRSHNSKIFAPLDELRTRYPGPVDLVVIGSGPGSYSGIRVGIAVGNGIAMADGCPALALASIAALDVPSRRQVRDFDVVGDARRGSYFYARIRGGRPDASACLLLEESAFHSALESATCEVYTMDEAPPHPRARFASPRAAILASLADALDPGEIGPLARLPLQPIYLRAPFTTKAKNSPFAAS